MGVVFGPNCPGCSRPIPEAIIRQALAQKKDLRCKCKALRSWKSLPPPEPVPPPQPLRCPDDDAPIRYAKEYIESRRTEGVKCPCCDQEVPG